MKSAMLDLTRNACEKSPIWLMNGRKASFAKMIEKLFCKIIYLFNKQTIHGFLGRANSSRKIASMDYNGMTIGCSFLHFSI